MLTYLDRINTVAYSQKLGPLRTLRAACLAAPPQPCILCLWFLCGLPRGIKSRQMTPLICGGRQRLFMHRRRDVCSAGTSSLLLDSVIVSHRQLYNLKCRLHVAALSYRLCAIAPLFVYFVAPLTLAPSFLTFLKKVV